VYPLLILPIALGGLLLLILLASLVCFLRLFYSGRRKQEEYPTPAGAIYDPFRERMIGWIREARALSPRDVEICSHDGLRLRGQYYEYDKNAPIEILFHGYRGTAKGDLSGGVYRCHRLGHSALIVNHRAAAESEGHIITFGERERLDVLAWVEFVLQTINPDARIILTGISMGAATVMLAAAEELPQNVIGVLADCGYTSTREIVCKVMREMHLSPAIFWPLARLGAILYGRFDPNAHAPIEAMAKCRLPVIFFHGDTDAFVPAEMSVRNYEACASDKKRLVLTPGAGHGLCFPVDEEGYIAALAEFFDPLTVT
jgi:fermentation-respiration switch protein FrsA (DUF1100 family)